MDFICRIRGVKGNDVRVEPKWDDGLCGMTAASIKRELARRAVEMAAPNLAVIRDGRVLDIVAERQLTGEQWLFENCVIRLQPICHTDALSGIKL